LLQVSIHTPFLTFDAMFLHIPPSPPTITYNANSLEARCRFSIAHELGHYVLEHRPISFSELFNGDLSRDARQEREANIFAAELLMPKVTLSREAQFRFKMVLRRKTEKTQVIPSKWKIIINFLPKTAAKSRILT